MNSLKQTPSAATSRPPSVILNLLLLAVVLLAIVLHVANRYATTETASFWLAPPTEEELAAWREQERIAAGGEHYKPLKLIVDLPPVDQPRWQPASEADLPDSTEIVGLEIDGQAFALDLLSMSKPERHIVNLDDDEQPVTVTYCNLVNCVRVLSRAADQQSLRVGGLDVDNQMVFLHEGERYGQQSDALPMLDYPFERMTIGDWKLKHPRSWIYVDRSAG